jgi:hypothetical protein
LLSGSLTIDEDIDVTADLPSFIENPSGYLRMPRLERAEQLDDGRTVDVVLCPVGRELAQGAVETQHGHALLPEAGGRLPVSRVMS